MEKYIIDNSQLDTALVSIGRFIGVKIPEETYNQMIDNTMSGLQTVMDNISKNGLMGSTVKELLDPQFWMQGDKVDDIGSLLMFIENFRVSINALTKLGIDIGDDYRTIAMNTYTVGATFKYVANKILTTALQNESMDDLLVNALVSMLTERMHKEKFMQLNNIDPNITNFDSLYEESYLEWISDEARSILKKAKAKPMKSILLYPEPLEPYLDEIKGKLPPELISILDGCEFDDLHDGEVGEKLFQAIKDLPNNSEIAQVVVSVINKYLKNQAVGEIDNDHQNPLGNSVYCSTNLPEIVVTAIILASAQISMPQAIEDDVSPTNTVVDIINEYLSRSNVNYSPYTAYRILSTVSAVTPMLVASSSMIKTSHEAYLSQATIVGEVLQNILKDGGEVDGE